MRHSKSSQKDDLLPWPVDTGDSGGCVLDKTQYVSSDHVHKMYVLQWVSEK